MSQFSNRMGEFFSAWVRHGTEGYPRHTKRKLIVTNVLVTIVIIACLFAVVAFSVYDFQGLKLAIAWILLALPFFIATPLLHKYNRYAGPLYQISTWYIFGLTLAWLLGAKTGFHFTFLAGMVSAILIFGVRQNPISIVNTILQFSFFIYAQWYWPEPSQYVTISESAQHVMFFCFSLIFMMTAFWLISYAFFQAHRAEQLLEQEYEYSERLLANMMPTSIAAQLKREPEKVIADAHEEATILFADVVGFTQRSSDQRPEEVVNFLNQLFTRFDHLATKHGIEKIKTLGDAFMVAGGMPDKQEDHCTRVALMALDMMDEARDLATVMGENIELRIGIHSGPVVAGVIGTKKPFYDVWGDTVNLAARLETNGKNGRIQITGTTKDLLGKAFHYSRRGEVELKGKGMQEIWYLDGRAEGTPISL